MINHGDTQHEVRSIKTINDTQVELRVLKSSDWQLNIEVIDDRPNCPWLIGFGQTCRVLLILSDGIELIGTVDALPDVDGAVLSLIAYARAKSVELFGP